MPVEVGVIKDLPTVLTVGGGVLGTGLVKTMLGWCSEIGVARDLPAESEVEEVNSDSARARRAWRATRADTGCSEGSTPRVGGGRIGFSY